ncbi:hypothetical protein D3C72_2022830 [compost metagenome]
MLSQPQGGNVLAEGRCAELFCLRRKLLAPVVVMFPRVVTQRAVWPAVKTFFRLFVAFQAEWGQLDGSVHQTFGNAAGPPAFIGLDSADVNLWVMHMRLHVSRRRSSIA